LKDSEQVSLLLHKSTLTDKVQSLAGMTQMIYQSQGTRENTWAIHFKLSESRSPLIFRAA